MRYVTYDKVLPLLPLDPNGCKIAIDVDEEHVRLHVGPRDWEWNKETGGLTSCGTDADPH